MKKTIITLTCMIFVCALFGQPQTTHWTQPMNYQSNMNVSSIVFMEDVEQNSMYLEIGAFCGNECRGCALPAGMVEGHALYLLTISANTNGEAIIFRLFDHQSNQELSYECTESLTFTADMVLGAYPDFYPFHFTTAEPPQSTHWTQPMNFQSNMSVNSTIFIEGVEQNSEFLEIGAFCGNECRGCALPAGMVDGHALYLLTISANTNGESLTFRLYNHWMGQELPYICTETMTFTADMIMGAYPDFYPFHFTTPPPNRHFTTDGNWSDASNWQGGVLPGTGNGVLLEASCTLDTNAEVASLTVTPGQTLTLQPGYTLTVTGSLTNTDASGLVIKDGAQLIHASEGVLATLEKNVTGYTDDNGYSLIAVPFANDISAPEQMLSGNYDLYLFDQSNPTVEWRNYKVDAFNLVRGTGYLYANNTGMTLSMAGPIPPTSNPYNVDMTFDANAIVPGFNLVGNPFTCNAYLANGEPYLVMNSDGSGLVLAETAAIPPMKGIFIEATENQHAVTFTTVIPRESKGRSVTLRLSGSRGTTMDVVRVNFDGSGSMGKLVLNEEATILYIPENGKNCTVAVAETEGQKPIHFEAGDNGIYTLTAEIENADFGYLHLIDHKTGNDIDLLANPSYSFEASPNDQANRFTLIFSMKR